MQLNRLKNKFVAIIKISESTIESIHEAKSELEAMGAKVDVLSIDTKNITTQKRDTNDVVVDNSIIFAEPTDYDALIVAGNDGSTAAHLEVVNYLHAYHSHVEYAPIVAFSSAVELLEEADLLYLNDATDDSNVLIADQFNSVPDCMNALATHIE